MMRKDVTPYSTINPKKESGVKRFIISLAGGAIGGLITFGVATMLWSPTHAPSSTNQSTANNQSSAQVSQVKYDVNSNISDAVGKVQPAVVSVINLQTRKANDPFGGLFGGQPNSQSEKKANGSKDDYTPVGEGSGVIYRKDGKKAYIVTNNHVVEGSDSLEVLMADGTKIPATLVGTDTYTDLAVLEIDSDKVTAVAEFGDSDLLKVGEPAIAIGSPLGSTYANSATQGIISATNRQILNKNDNGETVNINAIQTDAAINPGNSGGPLINAAGQVIGINSIKITQATSGVSAEGMGFSIPSNDVVAIISQLEKDGKVTRPMLGITMTDLSQISSEQQAKILKVPATVTKGVIIGQVQPASPAEKAGLQQYDVIVAIDGKDVESGTDLQSVLYSKKVGDTIKVTYYHQDQKKETSIELVIAKPDK